MDSGENDPFHMMQNENPAGTFRPGFYISLLEFLCWSSFTIGILKEIRMGRTFSLPAAVLRGRRERPAFGNRSEAVQEPKTSGCSVRSHSSSAASSPAR
jgi:hypothetical protein